MATPAGGTAISINIIATELGLGTYSTSQLYATCMAGGYGGLMYHNVVNPNGQSNSYGMGLSSNLDAKTAIYDPYNTGSKDDLKLSNWYNYYQNIEIAYDVEIYNNSGNWDVTFDLWLRDDTGANQFKIWSGTIIASTNQIFNNYCAANFFTNNTIGGYDFYIDQLTTNAPNSLGATITMAAPSVTDTDGVGNGTSRTGYQCGTNPFDDATSPFQSFVVCDDNGSLIKINKRTTLIITFV